MGDEPRDHDTGSEPFSRTARAEDVLALMRLAGGPGAVGAVLEWLARRTGGAAALVTGGGSVLAAAPSRPGRDALLAVAELHRRGTPSGVRGTGRGRTVHIVALGGDPYLVLEGGADERYGALLTDTARLLELSLRAEEHRRAAYRMEKARARGREAVLHLLVGGSVALAHRVAGAMGDRLPGNLRVCVVESPARERVAAAARLERAAPGTAWIVPCPVRSRHLIALIPAEDRRWEQEALDEMPECRIGASGEVPLRDTALAYEQAFHALSVARGAPARWSRFSGHGDLAPLLGSEGARWATRLLRPCLAYEPARRSDPGAEELVDTLASWLTFKSGAGRHLKIHRNTLTARLRVVEALLGLDLLTGVAQQSAVWLALRLRTAHTPPTPGCPTDLPTLLATPAAQTWARTLIGPLGPSGVDTVCAWLRADTRLSEAAAALGISPPGLRKRLVRAEEALGRSLLHAPSCTYELWLALKALDRI
ncbi:PucR family transcriptional regulator [Streptomyces sp. 8L]|uniref:PucR family transcriptional regulator n=1 Tax=Streptomyces sp. 8L TaxID=2877242 RepID=UPI001CD23244|nr:helix-turn-helix domain-containing protein [Streptomyces sp. 8L]MCA1219661.1 helix-turn-helix domain-containing protein [Streptomyces sp. 8L]